MPREVMDYDRFTADDLCGTCTLPVEELTNGWSGEVDLMRPKSAVNMISSADSDLHLARACKGLGAKSRGWRKLGSSSLRCPGGVLERPFEKMLPLLEVSEVKWDYEAFNPLIPPKQKTWPNQAGAPESEPATRIRCSSTYSPTRCGAMNASCGLAERTCAF